MKVAAIAALSFLLHAGCSKPPADPAPAVAPAVAATAPRQPVRVVATDEGFEAPASFPAGLRHLVFENRGSGIHEAMLIRLPEGMDLGQFEAAVQGGALFPKGALDHAGPGLTSPGETTEQWLRLEAGRYTLFCWNHSKSTHSRGIEVTAAEPDDPHPEADAVVRLKDYRFEIEGTLRKGVQVVRFETPGPSMHEADLFRLHEGKSVADFRAWRKHDGPGPAPADALGGVLDSHDIRNVVWVRRSFSPGRYFLFCEIPMSDTAAGGDSATTHDQLGMVREFEIEE